MNARPYPDPLPRGEGAAILNSWRIVSASRKSGHVFALALANVSPFPWGEGRGEGGRDNSIQSHGDC
jgi:hypothetical protein